ncbi:peptidase, C39 domain protein [Streptococcus oralis SK313]|uniref:Peptidase, C39 domain protein n=1 Tax=Streptococcus oralis SK313 TaxID=1035190 RepID=F9Q0K3_STROR|nr:peptidase, C39 domain protein [Streptococcus oralis SK313]
MVSHYKQATLLDCGMACVKTIISYYFPQLEHLDSLQFDNNSHQGLSLFEIEDVLKSYGIDADSYQIDTPSLQNIWNNEFHSNVIILLNFRNKTHPRTRL